MACKTTHMARVLILDITSTSAEKECVVFEDVETVKEAEVVKVHGVITNVSPMRESGSRSYFQAVNTDGEKQKSHKKLCSSK